jgi:broad specificity phosphatase PhoE
MAAASQLPRLFLARHGDTEWTDSRRHTGRTDIPLNERGEEHARELREWLRKFSFARVLTSPLQRARKTCELAGYGAVATVDPDLVEWNYGRFEGKKTAEILQESPGWELFRDGCPGGESPADVGARADRVARRVRTNDGNVLLFSSGHFLRVFAARWLGLEPGAGRYFLLGTATLSAVGYEHDRSDPVIRLWDETPRQGRSGSAPVRSQREEARR